MIFRDPGNKRKIIALLICIALGFAGWHWRDRWQAAAAAWRNPGAAEEIVGDETHGEHDHGHDHAAHDDPDSLTLTDQARRNIGLETGKIELTTFERTLTVPGIVVERPGRTKIHVATPLTGVVTDVRAVQGEAIAPGTLLFRIRLTHEDLVDTQTRFLQTLEELDVENREIARLEKLTEGVVAGKVVLERQYARQKLEALLGAQQQALILHGLSDEQVQRIRGDRKLLRELQVFAPGSDEHSDEFRLTKGSIEQVAYSTLEDAPATKAAPKKNTPFVVQDLNVHKGQSVQAGDSLCTLADFSELYIEGSAFEQDSRSLVEAANKAWSITAAIEAGRGRSETIHGLKIVYLANEVDRDTRALHFYVALPNEILRDTTTADEHRFIDWKYKPGQRLQVQVPVEQLPERIVLPASAVAADGAEVFVFQENGKKFVRRPVHVEYRDENSVVIAQDGSLFPGDVVALTGAHQMQVALKNKSGGPIDPHAGHHH